MSINIDKFVDYSISTEFARAIAKNDWSGLNASDTEKLKKFLRDKCYCCGFEDEFYSLGIDWDTVTGELADCHKVTFECD